MQSTPLIPASAGGVIPSPGGASLAPVPMALSSRIAGSLYSSVGFPLPRGQKTPWPSRLSNQSNTVPSKKQLFKRFAEATRVAKTLDDDIRCFLRGVVKANLQFRNIRPPSGAVEEITGRIIAESGFRPAALPALPALGAEVAALPADEIQSVMADAVVRLTETAGEQVVAGLDALRKMAQIGEIRWLGTDGICQFYYRRWWIKEETLREQRSAQVHEHTSANRTTGRTTTIRIERDVSRSHGVSIHVHDLLDARSCSVMADASPAPERVHELLEATPSWLLPLMKSVSGDEILHSHDEQTLGTHVTTEVTTTTQRQNVYRYDPCLVLGDFFVLTGWHDEEAKHGRVLAANGSVLSAIAEGCRVPNTHDNNVGAWFVAAAALILMAYLLL